MFTQWTKTSGCIATTTTTTSVAVPVSAAKKMVRARPQIAIKSQYTHLLFYSVLCSNITRLIICFACLFVSLRFQCLCVYQPTITAEWLIHYIRCICSNIFVFNIFRAHAKRERNETPIRIPKVFWMPMIHVVIWPTHHLNQSGSAKLIFAQINCDQNPNKHEHKNCL